jgi:DNA-binding MurR/RpiR family transcriptional regulator
MTEIVERLQVEARQLPPRLADAARFVASHAFDAATTPMRVLARRAGHSPATFTRLAQAVGYPGWDELREELVQSARESRERAPFSGRKLPAARSISTDMLQADTAALNRLDAEKLALAAAILENAPHAFIAGFRSCYGPAHLFHYLYRLFRPEVTLLGASGSLLDLELGALRKSDAVVLICFEPYSRDLLLVARAARATGCATIAVVDDAAAPIAREANLVLIHSTASPGFFPSLTACTALLQSLAALLYVRSGPKGRAALRRTEARIETHTAYIASEGVEI